MARTWKSDKHNTQRHAPALFKRLNRRRRRRHDKHALRVTLRRYDLTDLVLPRHHREDEWLWW